MTMLTILSLGMLGWQTGLRMTLVRDGIETVIPVQLHGLCHSSGQQHSLERAIRT